MKITIVLHSFIPLCALSYNKTHENSVIRVTFFFVHNKKYCDFRWQGYGDIANINPSETMLDTAAVEQVEIQVKYEGYIQRQLQQVEGFASREQKAIPADMNYDVVTGLGSEVKIYCMYAKEYIWALDFWKFSGALKK